jgi:hypothetical protein
MTGGIRRGVPIRAVSEFFVIVVGVLVALGVDSWASERADRTAEVEYLEQLATELRLDSALFAGFLMPNVIEARAALTRVRTVAAVDGLAPSHRILSRAVRHLEVLRNQDVE